ncbi:MAG: PDZ domain-containing protein [Fimbriimonadaceae bacterium]
MSKDNNGVKAALMVLGGAVALILGMVARDKTDLGGIVSRDPFTGIRVASRDDTPTELEIPEKLYFEQMAELLKRDYVDPVSDDATLLSGAVRGMVGSLNDPDSLFMDKDEFRVFQDMRIGKFEGIGAELYYTFPRASDNKAADGTNQGDLIFPKINVAAVTPGGPADKAGLRPGDVIDSVNGHWLINTDLIIKFRNLSKLVQEKKRSESELQTMRLELRRKTESVMAPNRARDLLTIGLTGTVDVSWLQDGKTRSAKIAKAASEVRAVSAEGGPIKLHLMTGIGAELQKVFPADGNAVLDLRNNNSNDLSVTRELLSVLGPAGNYGRMKSAKSSEPLDVKVGQAKAKKLTLIVDKSTNGAAAILARALVSKGVAKLQGAVGSRAYAGEVVRMPNGDGFTLVRAEYMEVKS